MKILISRSLSIKNVGIEISSVLHGVMKNLGTLVIFRFNIQLKCISVLDLVAVKRFKDIEFTGIGKIVQSTAEECREAYAIWIDLAHAVLTQKNLEKEEGPASNLSLTDQVLLGKQANTQNCEDLEASKARISGIMPDMKDVHQLITNPQENFREASAGYLLRDTLAKICASLRYQNMPSLLMVIVIALILLLMQISIFVLLSRPQRIEVIPRADYMSSMHGMAGNRAEALVSLNKQMKYLKEEMHLVETLLLKMQHEHALLEEKMKDLELFQN